MQVLRTVSFHVLMLFRGIFRFASKLLGGFFLCSFLAIVIMHLSDIKMMPIKHEIALAILSLLFALGFSMLGWYYDVLVLRLKPNNAELTLY